MVAVIAEIFGDIRFAGGFFKRIGHGEQRLVKELLHFFDAHVFRPQVDLHRVFLVRIPERQEHGAGALCL